MDTHTIKQAVAEVLKEKSPLSIEDIYERIIELELYDFGAKKPMSVLNIEIKRSSENVSYSKPYQVKLFRYLLDGGIELI